MEVFLCITLYIVGRARRVGRLFLKPDVISEFSMNIAQLRGRFVVVQNPTNRFLRFSRDRDTYRAFYCPF